LALYALGDLHLSLGGSGKPMDVFEGWKDYVKLLESNWKSTVDDGDTVVLVGDLSWAMGLQDAFEDLKFVNGLPGKKIIIKGNHDYWWSTAAKMNNYFEECGFSTLSILHNNFYRYEKFGICGTRGWISISDEPQDEKVLKREVQRLEVSVKATAQDGLEPIAFLHYPPVYGSSYNCDILDILYKYQVRRCYYGHIHGNGIKNAVNGLLNHIDFRLVSGDFLCFMPKKIE
jgi:predicted phosphohydrolase